jgi:hypothetical protein
MSGLRFWEEPTVYDNQDQEVIDHGSD